MLPMGIIPQPFSQMRARLGSSGRTALPVLELGGLGTFTIILEHIMSLRHIFLLRPPKRATRLLGGLLLLAQADPVLASPVVFTLDSTNSAITFSGSVNVSLVGAVPFTEQSAGSLTTHYSGTVLLDLTPPTVQFPGGSAIVAQTNGVWQPAAGGAAGSAPADYGGKLAFYLLGNVTAWAAGRNIALDIGSPALTLTNSGFNASRMDIVFLTNNPPAPVLDYQVIGNGFVSSSSGATALSGSLTNGSATAYLTNTAGLLKLVIPVSATNITSFNSPNDTTMVLKGQLVATAPESAWPLVVNIGVTGAQVTLTWPSVTGQVFTVLGSTDLHTWTTNSGSTVVNGNSTAWSAAQSGNSQFYRVRLQ
jgi:hypothetical protein